MHLNVSPSILNGGIKWLLLVKLIHNRILLSNQVDHLGYCSRYHSACSKIFFYPPFVKNRGNTLKISGGYKHVFFPDLYLNLELASLSEK